VLHRCRVLPTLAHKDVTKFGRAPSMSRHDVRFRLRAELEEVQCLSGLDFSGVGVIVWDGSSPLPVFSLCATRPTVDNASLASTLAAFGHRGSPLHDGFHVLTPDFEVHSAAMYFSPPVVPEAALDRTRGYGGRYVAALFGSLLPGVLATGVLSTNYGAIVFVHGQES
jgi:hypothetical protein